MFMVAAMGFLTVAELPKDTSRDNVAKAMVRFVFKPSALFAAIIYGAYLASIDLPLPPDVVTSCWSPILPIIYFGAILSLATGIVGAVLIASDNK
jgi:hypothetical protein